jgi:membrane glycosyltransferase
MNILNFLLLNWDSVLVVAFMLAVVIVLLAKKQYAILDKIILVLVTEAEKQYGGGTGAVKLAAVIDWVYPKIPAVIRLFITEARLVTTIERVLAEAKKKWDANPNISNYISTATPTE